MTSLYELGILGTPTLATRTALETELQERLTELGLSGSSGASIYIGDAAGFNPSGSKCCAALCFTTSRDENGHLTQLLGKGIPIVPVASIQKNFSAEIPACLRGLNGLALDKHSIRQIIAGLLECAELLPRQRRVFISYRRDHATEAALQVHAELSARGFDVFLDTHKIHPGEHFQEVLWQRLSDCEVMLMLDTKEYFESRWTEAEFGRAMLKGLAFVRVGWPSIPMNSRAGAAANVELEITDFDSSGKLLIDEATTRICEAVETARTKSVGMRYQLLMDTLQDQVSKVGGTVDGVSLRRLISITLANGKSIVAFPALGVPTVYTLHGATLDNPPSPVAVIYDDVGVDERGWRAQMDWLAPHINQVVRLVPSYKVAWNFSDWHAT